MNSEQRTESTMKLTLHVWKQAYEIEPERVLCNDVTLPWESHPHNMRLWIIGHEYGAVCAVWASSEQDALDEMVDKGLGECFLISDEDQAKADEGEREEWSPLGNAGELADLTNCWMHCVTFDPSRDYKLLAAFAEARGACADSLDDYSRNLVNKSVNA